jgi:hypothetical protein
MIMISRDLGEDNIFCISTGIIIIIRSSIHRIVLPVSSGFTFLLNVEGQFGPFHPTGVLPLQLPISFRSFSYFLFPLSSVTVSRFFVQQGFLHQARVHSVLSGIAVALMVFRSSGWGASYNLQSTALGQCVGGFFPLPTAHFHDDDMTLLFLPLPQICSFPPSPFPSTMCNSGFLIWVFNSSNCMII